MYVLNVIVCTQLREKERERGGVVGTGVRGGRGGGAGGSEKR